MDTQDVPECAVCLQTCNHPAKLPCGHIFCFLCVKGVAIQNKRCAMCRQEIPIDYLDRPVLLPNDSTDSTCSASQTSSDTFQWYYEGRNGWWRYDERSNTDLELAYNNSASDCQLLLAGAVYHVDFRTMLQYRRTDITRRRRVKRDIAAAPAKGIAGIKIMTEAENKNLENPDNIATNSSQEGERVTAAQASSTERQETVEGNSSDPVIIPPPAEFDLANSIRLLSLDNIEDLTEPDDRGD